MKRFLLFGGWIGADMFGWESFLGNLTLDTAIDHKDIVLEKENMPAMWHVVDQEAKGEPVVAEGEFNASPPRASFTNLRSISFATNGENRTVYTYGGAWKLESDMEDVTARDADVASTLHWHLEGQVSLDSLEGL